MDDLERGEAIELVELAEKPDRAAPLAVVVDGLPTVDTGVRGGL